MKVFQPDDGGVAAAASEPDDAEDVVAVPDAADEADGGGVGWAGELQDPSISASPRAVDTKAAGLLAPILAPAVRPPFRRSAYFPAGRSEVIIFRMSLYSPVSV
ncbi:hypothetical protein NKCBBBOE_00853 [Pseudarthrobacter sp. MM222]|nr:hypothetical protein NKCBBBOE_00853 [Pseudarthrobacter sp. MM222]